MKKQIGFYIIWDIAFIALLYEYSNISLLVKNYADKTWNPFSAIWIPLLILILVGGLIAGLVYVSNQYQFTKKLALIELLIIGIPAFYIATAIAMPFTIMGLLNLESTSYTILVWLIRSPTSISIGSILLGYEIFMFIIRTVKCKKGQNLIIEANADKPEQIGTE